MKQNNTHTHKTQTTAKQTHTGVPGTSNALNLSMHPCASHTGRTPRPRLKPLSRPWGPIETLTRIRATMTKHKTNKPQTKQTNNKQNLELMYSEAAKANILQFRMLSVLGVYGGPTENETSGCFYNTHKHMNTNNKQTHRNK